MASVFQMNTVSLVCLFACPRRLPPAGVWQAGKREGRAGGARQPGGPIAGARSEADELGGVKGRNDQMIGTTEGKGVAM